MEHDEAVAALESLPQVARIEVVRLRPTDVIVLEIQGWLTQEVNARLAAELKPIWPNNKIIVIDGGVRLKVIAGA